MRQRAPRERGQERMFHRCGCSAFITNLACLIIDQNNGWIRGAGPLFLFSAGKFQVGRWEPNAFGQGLTLCSGSSPLAILIVSTQTSPFQYLMFSGLFSLIIQLTVIFPGTGGAAAGSVRFHHLTWASRHSGGQLPGTVYSTKEGEFKRTKVLNMWCLHSNSMSREVETQKDVGGLGPMTSEATGAYCSWGLLGGVCGKICQSKWCCSFAPMNI